MSKAKPICDVFLSYGPEDKTSAAGVARILQASDLAVFDLRAIPQGKHAEDTVWEAMAESQAFVVVVSDAALSASSIFEFGAAQGWNKAVYVVVTDPASTHLPTFLRGFPVYPFSRLDELAGAIKNSSDVLSDSEKMVLIEEYHRIGEPVDELLLQPALLSKLTRQFKKRAKRDVVPEELLRTLLRLRKGGDLRTQGYRPGLLHRRTFGAQYTPTLHPMASPS
jgi:hypothetical protein